MGAFKKKIVLFFIFLMQIFFFFFYACWFSVGNSGIAAAAGIDQIVIGGSKTKWTTRMTHYAYVLYIYIYIYVYTVLSWGGGKKNNCERTHYTWPGGAAAKCLTRAARMQITRTTRRGRKYDYTSEKGSIFFTLFFSRTYIKKNPQIHINMTVYIVYVFTYDPRHVDTTVYRISYSPG